MSPLALDRPVSDEVSQSYPWLEQGGEPHKEDFAALGNTPTWSTFVDLSDKDPEHGNENDMKNSQSCTIWTDRVIRLMVDDKCLVVLPSKQQVTLSLRQMDSRGDGSSTAGKKQTPSVTLSARCNLLERKFRNDSLKYDFTLNKGETVVIMPAGLTGSGGEDDSRRMTDLAVEIGSSVSAKLRKLDPDKQKKMDLIKLDREEDLDTGELQYSYSIPEKKVKVFFSVKDLPEVK